MQRYAEQLALSACGDAEPSAGCEGHGGAIAAEINATLSSSGRPLEAPVRADMERAFGHDFGEVRIHTDGAAARSASGIQAAAYTVGSDIVFGHDAYTPGSSSGRHLLAHELAHVVQQRSGPVAGTPIGGGLSLSDPGDPFERAAEGTAREVTSRPTSRPERARRNRPPGGPAPAMPSAQSLLALQRSAGNAAVARWAAGAGSDSGARRSGPVDIAPRPIQRYSWDEFVSDAESAADTVSDLASDAYDSVSGAASDAYDTVSDAASEAVDWFADAAGSAALAAAQALASSLGGGIAITPTGFVITIGDIPLCTPFQVPISALPGFERAILAGLPIPISPTLAVVLVGGLMARLAPPTMTAYIGPCWLRNISIVFDFVAGHYSANGEWYVGAAISEVAEISAGPVGGAMLWWIEPPIPLIWVSLEGGLRLTLRASGLGGLQSTQTLAYDSGLGSIQFLTTNSLQLGSMFEADLDGYVSFSVYDTQICQWVWPLEHWETGTAAQYDLPINIGYGTGGPPVTIGPVTSAPIPYEDIEVAIDRRRPGTTCISLDDVIAWLCSMGLLPPTVCPSTVGPVTPGVLGDGEYPIVYRGGSAGRKNLTPRPVADPTGLSTFEKLEPATPPGGKAQMIDTTKFTELKGVQDPPPDYHVSITPGTAEKVAEWAATRDDESVPEHRWTKEVRAAIVKEVKRPK